MTKACGKHSKNPEWGYSQCPGCEVERLRSEIADLKSQLSESRANDRTAMGCLANLRQIAGGDDFPSLVRNVEAMAKSDARYKWLRGRLPGSAYRIAGVIYSEGGDGVDAAVDAAMSIAKEKGDD